MNKSFLITGANFSNKGAQAMLFVTVSELRDRFPNCKIYVETSDSIESTYLFSAISLYEDAWLSLVDKKALLIYGAKEVVKSLIRRKNYFLKYIAFRKDFKYLDAVLDISGFTLSSQFSQKLNERYLNRIEVCKKFNIPIYLMPQSFGPFKYSKEYQTKFESKASKLLRYPKKIFVRETQGYKELQKFNLENIIISSDLVLQNRTINMSNISTKKDLKDCVQFDTLHNVAIIPNVRTISHGDEKQVLSTYKIIIEKLVEFKKNVYIIRHSSEDSVLCEKIFKMMNEKENVYLISYDLNCIQFNNIIHNFDYVIASRYHAIVHSFKNCKPVLALGWAEKYKELLKLFNQDTYLFDVRVSVDRKVLEKSIEILENRYEIESSIISEKLEQIQENNCFDLIEL